MLRTIISEISNQVGTGEVGLIDWIDSSSIVIFERSCNAWIIYKWSCWEPDQDVWVSA